MKIITRKEALAQGLKRYFTGKPCKRGHVAERSTSAGCYTCRKAYRQSEEGKAASKAYMQSEKGKAARKAYAQSEEGTARALRKTLGLAPPSEYIEAVHAGRLIKRELIKLKEQNL
jgi:hypothetical protein